MEYDVEEGADANYEREQAADSIAAAIDLPDLRVLSKYHGETKEQTCWYIEPDSSINEKDGVGAEVVSSVYPLSDGLVKLEELFDWMINENCTTDKTTGLHINLSINGKGNNDYDFLKMILFFDENYVAKLFKRSTSRFAHTMRNKLASAIKGFNDTSFDVHSKLSNSDISKTLDILKAFGDSIAASSQFGKYSSILNRENGCFEFRNMGGTDYHKKYAEIRKQVINMAMILKIGSDDSLFVKEYLEKVYALFENDKFSDSTIYTKDKPKPAKRALPKELEPFKEIIRDCPPLSEQYTSLGPYIFLINISKIVKDKNIILDRRQKLQLRKIAVINKLTPDLLRKAIASTYGDDSRGERVCRNNNLLYNNVAELIGWPLELPNITPDAQEVLPLVRRGRTWPEDDAVDSDRPPHLPMVGDTQQDRSRWNDAARVEYERGNRGNTFR